MLSVKYILVTKKTATMLGGQNRLDWKLSIRNDYLLISTKDTNQR